MRNLFILLLIFCTSKISNAQDYYLTFTVTSVQQLEQASAAVSIDFVKDKICKAYASKQEMKVFQKLNIPYKLLPYPTHEAKVLNMATTIAEMENWDRYPTYEVYIAMLQKFAADYPQLCKIETIGTSVRGRELLAVKLSDNVTVDEAEPEFFYTSTIHGDETTGFVLMLRLIDELLKNYNNAAMPEAKRALDSMEIFINPNANPDGTYSGGNASVNGSVRYNANVFDLNRNFPDPRAGQTPNGERQKETQLMMDYAAKHHFVMSANFHGGAEVLNYPWDTWRGSDGHLHPDDAWYIKICKEYIDLARKLNIYYMTDVASTGYSNGGDWYVVAGGRQDYMNYWHHCKEITIEISSTKLLGTDYLNTYWNYNRNALYNYMFQCLTGVHGVVKNTKGNPLGASIMVKNMDKENSFVTTDSLTGSFFRLLLPGSYTIEISANGYETILRNITIASGQITFANDIVMQDAQTSSDNITNNSLQIYPNPTTDFFYINQECDGEMTIAIYTTDGKLIQHQSYYRKLNRIETANWQAGLYLIEIQAGSKKYQHKLLKITR